jgi:hypothetical protein
VDSKNRFAFVACVVALFLLVFALRATHKLPPSSFKAFYCAGQAVLDGRDPYVVEPLRTCERIVAPGALPAYAVEPAPLPGYAIGPFVVAALAPPDLARDVYFVVLIAALAVTATMLARLAPLPAVAVLLALLATWFLNLSYGEPPPITTACIVLAALMLQRNRPWVAAVAAGGLALEPHLAAPLWLALALFAPRTRLPLLVVGCALIALDAAIGGPHAAVEYFVRTLPAQALSEVSAADQFSLTHVAVVAGASVPLALRLGFISYAVMAVLGILVARRLSLKGAAPEYLALVPPAFILVGGTYLHDIQFYSALPLALVLLARAPRPSFGLAAATVLLAVPWVEASSRLMLVLSATSVFAIGWIALPKRPWRIAACAGAAIIAVALVIAIGRLPAVKRGTIAAIPSAATALRDDDQAPLAWSIYLGNNPILTSASPRSLIRMVPTWGGALLLVFCSLALAGRARTLAPPEPLAAGRSAS